MGHEGQPGKYEGAASVLPVIAEEIGSTDGRYFFDQKPEQINKPGLVVVLDTVAVEGLTEEQKELKRLRELHAELWPGTKISIWDGLGAQYGTLFEKPTLVEDNPLQVHLAFVDSQTEKEVRRVAALSSITPSKE